MLWYKNTEKPIPYAVAMDERGGTGTDFFHARQGRWDNSIGVNGSYNLIMPYWIGRYNGLLKEESAGGDITADVGWVYKLGFVAESQSDYLNFLLRHHSAQFSVL